MSVDLDSVFSLFEDLDNEELEYAELVLEELAEEDQLSFEVEHRSLLRAILNLDEHQRMLARDIVIPRLLEGEDEAEGSDAQSHLDPDVLTAEDEHTTTRAEPPLCTLRDRLPAELRIRIYEHVLLTGDGLVRITPTSFGQPGLLMTCKQVRHEALELYYLGNNFVVDAVNLDPRLGEAFVDQAVGLATRLKLQLRLQPKPDQHVVASNNFMAWAHAYYHGDTPLRLCPTFPTVSMTVHEDLKFGSIRGMLGGIFTSAESSSAMGTKWIDFSAMGLPFEWCRRARDLQYGLQEWAARSMTLPSDHPTFNFAVKVQSRASRSANARIDGTMELTSSSMNLE